MNHRGSFITKEVRDVWMSDGAEFRGGGDGVG